MLIKDMIEQKKRYRRYTARRKALPKTYSWAVGAVEKYIWHFASGRMDSMLPLLEDLIDLFEQSAEAKTPLRDVVGEDPVEFAETLLRNYPDHMWIEKQRRHLTEVFEQLEQEENR